ncbi:MAG: hypothetical protein JOY66_01880 [Acetobacteraceae bacterium]|nr:hypothetical protein [Acetobacteraceae bacterium]
MSDEVPNPDVPADLRAILAGIDRDLAESAKLRPEGDKLAAERDKLPAERDKLAAERDKLLGEQLKLGAEQIRFNAEQLKLNAEAAKLNRDRWWQPALAIVGLIGGLVTAGGAIWHALHGG